MKHHTKIRQHHLVQRSKTLIKEHAHRRVTMRELSELLNVSSSYLSRVFMRIEGIAFSEYQERVRLRKAKELLTQPTLPVKAVAMESGYSGLEYFCMRFKQLTGQTPSEYRASKLSEEHQS